MSWQDIFLNKLKNFKAKETLNTNGEWIVFDDMSGKISNEDLESIIKQLKRITMIAKFKCKSWLYFSRQNSKQEGHPLHCSLCKERYFQRKNYLL